jgi:acetolactate synthase small subunit
VRIRLKLATSFDVSVGAHTLEATDDCLILEITGGAGQIDDFLGSMQSVDIIEVIRTGITAIACGSKPT